MNKCIDHRVEGRRPVARPKSTWLESVEVDMAKLEIDKEVTILFVKTWITCQITHQYVYV